MQVDLFKTKEIYLKEFCKQRGYFSSHDINYYGTTHFYDSATRRIREWCQEGKIRRLDKKEKTFRGFMTKCAVYFWIDNVH
jgi:hypothetical protein